MRCCACTNWCKSVWTKVHCQFQARFSAQILFYNTPKGFCHKHATWTLLLQRPTWYAISPITFCRIISSSNKYDQSMYSYVIVDMYNFVPNIFNNYVNAISRDNNEDYNDNIKHKRVILSLSNNKYMLNKKRFTDTYFKYRIIAKRTKHFVLILQNLYFIPLIVIAFFWHDLVSPSRSKYHPIKYISKTQWISIFLIQNWWKYLLNDISKYPKNRCNYEIILSYSNVNSSKS